MSGNSQGKKPPHRPPTRPAPMPPKTGKRLHEGGGGAIPRPPRREK